MAGVATPVTPSPRVKYLTEPQAALPETTPLIVDLPTGSYVRGYQGRAMVGVQPLEPVTSFEVDVAPGLLDWMASRAAIRFPSLRGATVSRLITGLYEVTPDGLPIAGEAPGLAGFWTIAGFNGHGVMHGPGVAGALAELIAIGQPQSLDVLPLRPERFSDASMDRAAVERTLL
jgi:sarcosine oxidase subunit beta